MPILTHQTTLKSGTAATSVTKLVDIKNFPALSEPAEAVEVTTLSDTSQTYIKGIKQVSGQLQFTANYDSDVYDTLVTRMATDKFFELTFSDGSGFAFGGSFDISLSEGDINSPVEMIVTNYPNSAVTKKAKTA